MTERSPASLNFREINRLLAEVDLTGAVVQEFFQPRPDRLIIGFFQAGRLQRLCFTMSQPACRFHLYTAPIGKEKTKQRFVAFLSARLQEAVVEGIDHVRDQRILKMSFLRGGRRYFMWVRLWSSAPNIIFTDESGRIGDALFRRPKKREISGGRYDPEEELGRTPAPRNDPERFTVRDFGGDPGKSLHERVEAYFQDGETRGRETGLRERLLHELSVEERRLLKALESTETWLAEHGHFERYRQYGDILMADLAAVKPAAGWYRGLDFFNHDEPIDIELKKELSPAQNAEYYYRLAKKTRATHERMADERSETKQRLAAVRERIRIAETTQDAVRLEELSRALIRQRREEPAGATPGLSFTSGGFTILVGRTARENEELFRRHVRGNDFWMHVRDFPGASVYIKSRKEKSIPLDVLLDAANLALFYSKAKSSGKADLYYTRVKYVKKAKGGKTGLFLPTQEKNIAVRLDPGRIGRLKGLSENDD